MNFSNWFDNGSKFVKPSLTFTSKAASQTRVQVTDVDTDPIT